MTTTIIDPVLVQEARSFLQSISRTGDEDGERPPHVFLTMKESTTTDTTTGKAPRPRPRGGTIAWLTLYNPRRRNALTPAMMLDMERAIAQLERECTIVGGLSLSSPSSPSSSPSPTSPTSSKLGALVVTGHGRSFCSGLDLSSAAADLVSPRAGLLMSTFMQQLLYRLQSLPLVSVAALDGTVSNLRWMIEWDCSCPHAHANIHTSHTLTYSLLHTPSHTHTHTHTHSHIRRPRDGGWSGACDGV